MNTLSDPIIASSLDKSRLQVVDVENMEDAVALPLFLQKSQSVSISQVPSRMQPWIPDKEAVENVLASSK